MTLLSDIETIKTDIASVLKVGTDQVPLSQKELLVYGILVLLLNRSSEGGTGGVVDNQALATAIANALETKTLTVAGDSVNESALASAIAANTQPVNQISNAVTGSITFTGNVNSNTFSISNRLALIVIPAISATPTLTLQVSLDGGTTWGSTSVTTATNATTPTVLESDSLARVSGAIGLVNAFRFLSSTAITATLAIRSVVQ